MSRGNRSHLDTVVFRAVRSSPPLTGLVDMRITVLVACPSSLGYGAMPGRQGCRPSHDSFGLGHTYSYSIHFGM